MDPTEFLLGTRWSDIPGAVRHQAKRALLDLLGIAAGGATTELSAIIRKHAATQFGGSVPMAFDGRGTSPAGFALALGMTADALDGHDGLNPVKGHVSCGLMPAALATALSEGRTDGEEFLTTLCVSYEIAARAGLALHTTAHEYHTSGAWVALGAAAAGARLLGLSRDAAEHALGIAEYHGPRSPMLRVIDHPTMLKDGSGWGSMTGVSAAYLARDGFTGAPAALTSEPEGLWTTLGNRWLILEQYYKPYPVCRWAQPPVEAATKLVERHNIRTQDIARIEIETFRESTLLAVTRPATTEEAQYSTAFPVAVALARGGIGADDLSGDALEDPAILRVADLIEMREAEEANAQFPDVRLARATITLKDGTRHASDWHRPLWDAEAPPSDAELRAKFDELARPVLGCARADTLADAVLQLDEVGLGPLAAAITQPIRRDTTSWSAA